MCMKSRIWASLLIACLPWLAMAQSNDDLYFVPKKEKKTEQKKEVQSAPKQTSNNTTVYAAPGSTIVVKDVTGKLVILMNTTGDILRATILFQCRMIHCI